MPGRRLIWRDKFSRALDLTVAALAVAFLSPLLLAVAFAIWLEDRGPVLFRHRRIGRGGVAFDCLKFRTMSVDAEARLAQILASDPAARSEWARSQKLREDPRVTSIGRFLRRSSIDELPQLINVLRGEMAMVGPRPIVEGEIARYGVHFRHYCAVRPGMTGLWQVSGRNNVSFRRRVVLDVAYVRARCLSLDIKILAKTAPAVIQQRGSY